MHMHNLVDCKFNVVVYCYSHVDILAHSLPLQLPDFLHHQRDATHRLLVLLLVAQIARIDAVVDGRVVKEMLFCKIRLDISYVHTTNNINDTI